MNKKPLFSITKKDLEITYFSGTGGGGQHRNRHMNCVRIKHKESGALVTGQSQKSKEKNTREALNNLINNPKFKMWHMKKVAEVLTNKTIDDVVDEMMNENNLKIEKRDSETGKWIDYEE